MSLNEFIPKYIRQDENLRPKSVVTADRWNELWDLSIQQGDHSEETLAELVPEVLVGVKSDDVRFIRLNEDNVIETSADEVEWFATGSSGHLILDATGAQLPQRSRLKFSNATLTDNGTETVVTALTGPQGIQGPIGPQGIQGSTGIQGNTGESIIPNVDPNTGLMSFSKGVAGAVPAAVYVKGPQGPQGVAGTQGPQGQIGPQGSQGTTGNTGGQGPQGIQGPLGPQGVQGIQGNIGNTGQQGPIGAEGPKGDDGANGASFVVLGLYDTLFELQTAHPVGVEGDAYAVGISTNNVIYNWDVDAVEWVNLGSLQGPTGPQGPAGANGTNGLDGADAVAGKLPSAYVEMSAPKGVTSATLIDVPGMATTIHLDEAVEIAVMASFEAQTQVGATASTLGIAININGTDYDAYERYLSGSNDKGLGAIIHRSVELAAGDYVVKLRFQRTLGTSTPGLNHADMLVMAMQGAKGEQGPTGAQGVQGLQGIQGIQGIQGPAGTTDYNDLTNKPDIPTDLWELTEDATHRIVTDTEKSTWNGKAPSTVASSGVTGLMPGTDKTKLDAIAAGATANVVENVLTSTSTVNALSAKMGKDLNDIVSNKSAKSTIQNKTLSSASWTGASAPYSYSLSVTGVTTTSVQEVLPTTDITSAQLTALLAATIQDGGQSADTIVLKCWGTKPTIDLPIRVILRGDI